MPTISPDAPSSSSRSGARTAIVPENSAGSITSQMASSTAGLATARPRVRQPGLSGEGAAGMSAAQAASPAPITATPVNTGAAPTTVASPPSTGPSRLPAMAAARADPTSRPR